MGLPDGDDTPLTKVCIIDLFLALPKSQDIYPFCLQK
jgi:hypothetical protein